MKRNNQEWEKSGKLAEYREKQRKALLGGHGYGRGARGRLDHASAKHWIVRDPFGKTYEFVNCREWVRQNLHLFHDDRPEARMPFWLRVASGLKNIARPKIANAPTHYKGWTIVSLQEGAGDLLGRDESEVIIPPNNQSDKLSSD